MKSSYTVFCFFLIVLFVGIACADNQRDTLPEHRFRINGEIRLIKIESPGELFILLVNADTFKKPLHSYKKIIIPIGDKEIKAKRVQFEFESIPKGKYGIRCYLDTNGNKKLDKGMIGPKEPWGMSWQGGKVMGWPKFEDICFELRKDLNNLVIKVK